ncbi:hypothetical protein QTP86_033635, partial [Hemibagrus guttatus]
MKYQKYITVMQMAMGVTASNKDDCIPPKRQLCQGSSWDLGTEVSGVFTARAASHSVTPLTKHTQQQQFISRAFVRITENNKETIRSLQTVPWVTVCPHDLSTATVSTKKPRDSNHGVPPSSDAAASSSAVPPGVAVSQGKPSLRRIKGRVHRSKSLDSIDLLDCNVSRQITFKRTMREEQNGKFAYKTIRSCGRLQNKIQ